MRFAKTLDLAGTIIIIADIAWNVSDRDAPGNRSILSELTVKDNDKVLEVSTGTGDNFRFLNKNAVYYGVDISLGMLKQAKKHVKRWNRDVRLINCEGEELPFRYNYFDVVFHCGGINYFNDKQKAIHEMIRVAKPSCQT